ncbi:hypothetical protein Ddye_026491 [Dipteronia dyeriana]|uniref:Uncharacterized protein n=1 Tax=Dipteronia dyeriana TaxID=168575 RepID=A0AAD9TMD7_9ROSI|nr:hypothetical protein Ddye_026491 [Dipteronia dyeriana]
MAIMERMFQNVISNAKAEGLIVGYPSIRIKEMPNAVETKIFVDKLGNTRKFEGLKYTYWCTTLASKTQQKVSEGHDGYSNEMIEALFEDSATNILQHSQQKVSKGLNGYSNEMIRVTFRRFCN